jgi:hypothetical protein
VPVDGGVLPRRRLSGVHGLGGLRLTVVEQGGELGGAQRPGEVVALAVLAAGLAQLVELGGVPDAFGDRGRSRVSASEPAATWVHPGT